MYRAGATNNIITSTHTNTHTHTHTHTQTETQTHTIKQTSYTNKQLIPGERGERPDTNAVPASDRDGVALASPKGSGSRRADDRQQLRTAVAGRGGHVRDIPRTEWVDVIVAFEHLHDPP